MRNSAVWSGVVRYGTVSCGVVLCGAVGYCAVQWGTVLYRTVSCRVVSCRAVWYGASLAHSPQDFLSSFRVHQETGKFFSEFRIFRIFWYCVTVDNG